MNHWSLSLQILRHDTSIFVWRSIKFGSPLLRPDESEVGGNVGEERLPEPGRSRSHGDLCSQVTGISLSPGLYQHERLSTDSLPSDVPCVHCSVVSVTICPGHCQPIRGQLSVSADQSAPSPDLTVNVSFPGPQRLSPQAQAVTVQ